MVISKQRVSVGSTATGLTVPSGARGLWMQADGGHVRYAITGEDPTASTGYRLLAGMSPEKINIPDFDLNDLRFISESGTVALEVTFFG